MSYDLSIYKTVLEKVHVKSASDVDLINLSLNGSMDAFSTIVSRYESMIAKITISMIGNKDDADDIGQETFIRFYKSMDKFKGDSKLGTYLARTAINLTLNEIKKRKKRWLVTTNSYENFDIPSIDNEESQDITNVVNESLKKLEPKYRSVVVLRFIQGFSTKETSEILELPLGTVLSRLSRGQQKLKEIITKADMI